MTEKNQQMRPASPAQAPDPATTYERAKPEKEAGMGRLDNNPPRPHQTSDKMEDAVTNKQANRQINAEDVVNNRASNPAMGSSIGRAPEQPDHSMKDEEPMGSDQAPSDIHNPRDKRHPKTEGKGGTL